MSSVSKSTYKYLPYTGVGERQRRSGGLRVLLPTRRQSARGRRFSVHGVASAARDASPFSVSDRIQASPRHRGFRAALGSRKRETLPRPSMRTPDARSAVRVRRFFLLACLGGGASGCGSERVRSEETIRPAPARCGPGPVSPGTFAFSTGAALAQRRPRAHETWV